MCEIRSPPDKTNSKYQVYDPLPNPPILIVCGFNFFLLILQTGNITT